MKKGLISFGLFLGFFLQFVAFAMRSDGPNSDAFTLRASFVIIALAYAFRYWRKAQKRSTDTFKFVVISVWSGLNIGFSYGVLFDPIVFYAFCLIGAAWFVLEMIDLSKKRTKGVRLLLLFGGALLALQIIFKIQHWPGAVVMTITPWLLFLLGFGYETVVKLKPILQKD